MKIIDIKSRHFETSIILNDIINVILSIDDIIVIGLKNGKIRLTDENFGIYNYIDNIIKYLMKEFNIKEKQTIGNTEIYSKILLLSMVK